MRSIVHRHISRMEIARSEWEKLISVCAVTSEDGFRFSCSIYQNIAIESIDPNDQILKFKTL